MFVIQILVQTEYQDVYRVVDGVLFIVNKFVPIDYGGNKYVYVYDVKQSKYNKNCQDWLKVLKTDYYEEHNNIIIPKGTITYKDSPVVSIKNKSDYEYQIKTTGESFSGKHMQMIDMLNTIMNLIN